MDNLIIVSSLAAFFLFLAVQTMVFRRIGDRWVLPMYFALYGAVGIVSVALAAWVAGPTVIEKLMGSVLVGTIYTLLVFTYLLCVFGIMESSVRVRVLTEIARAGTRGLSKEALLERYNSALIIRKRLARCVAAGDVMCSAGKYSAGRRVGLFSLPAFVLDLIWRVYGETNKS